MPNYYTGCTQLTSVSVTTSPTKLLDNSTTMVGQTAFTIPLHNLTGFLYILVTPTTGREMDGTTTIDATYMTNYGTQWSATDKVATINVSDGSDIFGMTSTGTFTAYPSRWS